MKKLYSCLPVLSLLFLSITNFAVAQNNQAKLIDARWELCYEDHTQRVYLDNNSVTFSNVDNSYTCWFKWTYKTDEIYNGKYIDEEKHQVKFYCGKRKYNYMYCRIYYKDNTSESAFFDKDVDIMPETIFETFYLKICNNF